MRTVIIAAALLAAIPAWAAPAASCQPMDKKLTELVGWIKWRKENAIGKYPSKQEMCNYYNNFARLAKDISELAPKTDRQCTDELAAAAKVQQYLYEINWVNEDSCIQKKYYNWAHRAIEEPIPPRR